MIRVGIVGGTGYAGAELLRLLARHPDVQLVTITSRSEAGLAVAELFPSLRGHVTLQFSRREEARWDLCDVVFFATPHGVAMAQAREVLAEGAKIIDLAADFRLSDPAEFERWYKMPHVCPELLEEAVYGLPEINRASIRKARIVGAPGCYPTAVLLGLIPLVEAGIVDSESLIADCKSGISGAGRKVEAAFLYAETSDSIKAYAISGHRHLPEIVQSLRRAAKSEVNLTFVPHLTPMIRGIHATLYARLTQPDVDLQSLFASRYRDEPFVDVLPANSHPDTRSVRGSNMCRIALHRPNGGNLAIVLAVEDNLVKGAAGQAIQNMNLMFGLAETTGLLQAALAP